MAAKKGTARYKGPASVEFVRGVAFPKNTTVPVEGAGLLDYLKTKQGFEVVAQGDETPAAPAAA